MERSEEAGGIRTLGLCYLKLSRYRLDRELRRAGLGFLGGAGAATLLIALAAYVLSLRMVRPIEGLRAAAEGVARADFMRAIASYSE